jgi:UDP-N-acetylmuramoyl-L-alanyl-D-glutamate--2,6-diaminopimelate ligase
MAAVAEQAGQRVVLTSDNPRSEDPGRILEQMVQGIRSLEAVLVEPDRAAAIAMAVKTAGPQDVVLIAGKGHEDYQEIRGVKHPFSDLAHASAALESRSRTAGAQA